MIELLAAPDQHALCDATSQFLGRTASSAQVREHAERGGGIDEQWWSVGAELGWVSLLVPESLGGGAVSEAGLLDLALIAEQLGRHAAPGALAPISAAVSALADPTAVGAQRELLDAVVAGQKLLTWAVHEPDEAWDPTRPRTRIERRGSCYVMNGIKDRVEAGDQADHLLVGALLDGELVQFVVPADAPGVSVEPVWALDLTRRFATARFDGVELSEDQRVRSDRPAAQLIETQQQVLHVLQAAETAGAVGFVFEMTHTWTADRFAFGRPLGSYQAIKHRMADMVTLVHAIQAIVRDAALAVSHGDARASQLARIASLFTATRSLEIMQDCVQIHGGIGVTWEHDLHLYLRRAVTNRAHYGTPEELRSSLSVLLDQ